jgi:hypothetical protein
LRHGDTQQQKEKLVILPPFWSVKSAAWLAIAESKFIEKIVVSEWGQFDLLLAAIQKKILDQIIFGGLPHIGKICIENSQLLPNNPARQLYRYTSVLIEAAVPIEIMDLVENMLEDFPYDTLKACLLEMHTLSDQKKMDFFFQVQAFGWPETASDVGQHAGPLAWSSPSCFSICSFSVCLSPCRLCLGNKSLVTSGAGGQSRQAVDLSQTPASRSGGHCGCSCGAASSSD